MSVDNNHEKEAVRMPVVTLAVCRKNRALNEIPIMNRCLISLIRGLCGENADENLLRVPVIYIGAPC